MCPDRRSHLSEGRLDETYAVLSSPRSRSVLSVLSDRPDGVGVSELATLLARREEDASARGVPETERERVRTSLHHRHLPKLEGASLVECEDGEVRPGARLSDDDVVETALDLDLDPETADAVFELLAAERRRTLLELLANGSDYTVSDLASVLAAVSDTTERDAEISLLHNHLPKLERAGVISHDRDTRRVSYRGIPIDDAALGRLLAAGDGWAPSGIASRNGDVLREPDSGIDR